MRRKLLLSVATALLVPALSHAQSLGIGVLGGGSMTTLTGINTSSSSVFNGLSTVKYRMGFLAGGYIRLGLGSMVSLEPEAYYATKGADLDIGAGSGQATGKLQLALAYAEVPVLLRINLMPSGSVRPFIVAGPSFSLRMDCKLTLTSGSTTTSYACDKLPGSTANTYAPDGYEKTDMGGVVGVGIGTSHLSVQGRYSRGFTTVNKDKTNGEAKNAAYSLLLSIGM